MEFNHDVCIEPGCGESSASHHAFKAPVRPEGCICDPLSYADPDNIPKICGEYAAGSSQFVDRYCLTCDHDFECHKVQK